MQVEKVLKTLDEIRGKLVGKGVPPVAVPQSPGGPLRSPGAVPDGAQLSGPRSGALQSGAHSGAIRPGEDVARDSNLGRGRLAHGANSVGPGARDFAGATVMTGALEADAAALEAGAAALKAGGAAGAHSLVQPAMWRMGRGHNLVRKA
ncbi:hypothetical protein RIF29_10681 [Crotalaria pallida]|uniref:Uncharacterized protein n=1 Tax=Crotalaria pallida TaxID=3830 RepID=A0AAN9G085_CROPI